MFTKTVPCRRFLSSSCTLLVQIRINVKSCVFKTDALVKLKMHVNVCVYILILRKYFCVVIVWYMKIMLSTTVSCSHDVFRVLKKPQQNQENDACDKIFEEITLI